MENSKLLQNAISKQSAGDFGATISSGLPFRSINGFALNQLARSLVGFTS